MEYEQRYKEALEQAKKELEACGSLDCDAASQILRIFPELEQRDDSIFKELLHNLIVSNESTPSSKEIFSIYGKTKEDCLAWIEKQCKQKPFNYENANIRQKDFSPKIKPKFDVGDWVVRNYQNNVRDVDKVVNIKLLDDGTYGYNLEDETYFAGSFEEKYHIWSIKDDAKNGDILCYKDAIFLLRYYTLSNKVVYHCCYNKYFSLNYEYSLTKEEVDKIHPATRKQRNFLFQKMKEAGFKWDDNKKELIRF